MWFQRMLTVWIQYHFIGSFHIHHICLRVLMILNLLIQKVSYLRKQCLVCETPLIYQISEDYTKQVLKRIWKAYNVAIFFPFRILSTLNFCLYMLLLIFLMSHWSKRQQYQNKIHIYCLDWNKNNIWALLFPKVRPVDKVTESFLCV